MENYFNTTKKELCNGCSACSLVCPTNAIEMIEDEEGFLYPKIDENKCIKCNKCRKVCSNSPKKNEYEIKAYAIKNKNEEERKNSTSGGMFKILAEYVIQKQGIVFGVKLNENLVAIHDYSETIEGCKEFSFSKYVRSDLGDSYKKVKAFLEDNRYVLFTGTPCQIQGLRSYLGRDNEKLILCEIICHANPSPKILKMYIKNHENIEKKKVKAIYFRSKNKEMNNSAYIEFKDGTKKKMQEYITAFSGNQLINRPSCYNCQFVDENRKADFTIGDFWGIEKVLPDFNDDKGISLLTVNTKKAEKIFDEIKQHMDYKQTDLNLAFKYNHHSNVPINKSRQNFFEDIINGKINENNIIKKLKSYTGKPIYKKVLTKTKKIIKKIIKKEKKSR